MIKYRLRCDIEHGFDVWFRDSAAYDKQAAAGLLACPHCGSSSVSKALMAPSVTGSPKRRRPEEQRQAPPAGPRTGPDTAEAGPPSPGATAGEAPGDMARMREKLQALRAEVESKCDYVGRQFAEEARKIHYGETDPHAIYGEATPKEAKALHEEGITFSPIPWLPKSDA